MKLNELIKKKLSTIGLHDEVFVNYDTCQQGENSIYSLLICLDV